MFFVNKSLPLFCLEPLPDLDLTVNSSYVINLRQNTNYDYSLITMACKRTAKLKLNISLQSIEKYYLGNFFIERAFQKNQGKIIKNMK